MQKLTIILFFISIQLCYPQSWENISKLGYQAGGPSGFMTDGENLYLMSYYKADLVLTKSTDKGKTWFTQYQVNTDIEFGQLHSVRYAVLADKSYIYAIFTNRRNIAKSSDGGKTFEMINLGDGDSFYQICMYNRNIGVAMTTGEMFITEDGWLTYKRVSNKFYSTYYAPIFTDESNIQFISGVNKVRVMTNFNLDKEEWSIFYSFPEENQDAFLDLEYTENGLGFIAGLRRNGNGDRATDVLRQSTDYGKSWESKIDANVEPQWGLSDISFNDTLNGFATGQLGKILMTNDGGKTWDYVPDLDFYEGGDSLYGPFTMEILWMKDKPYLMTGDANLYSIDTDYFNLYDRFTISGTVLNNGVPIYIPLRKGKKVIYTYDDGSYEFEKVPNGTYTIVPEPTDYFTFTPMSVEVNINNSNSNHDFVATRKQFQLVGDLNNRINADISNLKFRVEYQTNDGFEYKLDTLIGLTAINKFVADKLYANKEMKITPIDDDEDYTVIPSEYSINFISDTTLKFDILSKDENFSISGRFHVNGKGIEEIGILVYFGSIADSRIVYTDKDGYYRIYNAKKGEVGLFVESVSFANEELSPKRYQFNLESHVENKDFSLKKWEYKRFRGKVTDKNGKGIPNIRIMPFYDVTALYTDIFGIRTREDGNYTSQVIAENSYPKLNIYLEDNLNFTPKFYTLDLENKLDGYDFVIDTVLTDVPYRLQREITIYPNPTTNQITVDLVGGLLISNYKIIDIEGRILLKSVGDLTSSQTIDVHSLPVGTYQIELTTATGETVQDKFVKR